MKFALRDDDLNYFFSPTMIENNIDDIWDICPVSMSVIPFVIGNWEENIKLLEDSTPGDVSKEIIQRISSDRVIYDIAKNHELVDYIKCKMSEGRVYLTLHGIHHRNSDSVLPEIKNNYSISAEFYTSRDLSDSLMRAKSHVEEIFNQNVEVFTPPQNLYNYIGYRAIERCDMNICAYLPSARKDINETIRIIGLRNYFNLIYHKLSNRRSLRIPYGKYMSAGRSKIIEHWALQPGTSIAALYADFNKVYSKGGNFVLSTHSCGFKKRMNGSNYLMGDVLREFLMYASKKSNIKFVALNEMFA